MVIGGDKSNNVSQMNRDASEEMQISKNLETFRMNSDINVIKIGDES